MHDGGLDLPSTASYGTLKFLTLLQDGGIGLGLLRRGLQGLSDDTPIGKYVWGTFKQRYLDYRRETAQKEADPINEKKSKDTVTSEPTRPPIKYATMKEQYKDSEELVSN